MLQHALRRTVQHQRAVVRRSPSTNPAFVCLFCQHKPTTTQQHIRNSSTETDNVASVSSTECEPEGLAAPELRLADTPEDGEGLRPAMEDGDVEPTPVVEIRKGGKDEVKAELSNAELALEELRKQRSETLKLLKDEAKRLAKMVKEQEKEEEKLAKAQAKILAKVMREHEVDEEAPMRVKKAGKTTEDELVVDDELSLEDVTTQKEGAELGFNQSQWNKRQAEIHKDRNFKELDDTRTRILATVSDASLTQEKTWISGKGKERPYCNEWPVCDGKHSHSQCPLRKELCITPEQWKERKKTLRKKIEEEKIRRSNREREDESGDGDEKDKTKKKMEQNEESKGFEKPKTARKLREERAEREALLKAFEKKIESAKADSPKALSGVKKNKMDREKDPSLNLGEWAHLTVLDAALEEAEAKSLEASMLASSLKSAMTGTSKSKSTKAEEEDDADAETEKRTEGDDTVLKRVQQRLARDEARKMAYYEAMYKKQRNEAFRKGLKPPPPPPQLVAAGGKYAQKNLEEKTMSAEEREKRAKRAAKRKAIDPDDFEVNEAGRKRKLAREGREDPEIKGRRKKRQETTPPKRPSKADSLPRTKLDITETKLEPLEVKDQPPVAKLLHDLDRVLFNEGVYMLRDPRSGVFNFDPYLQDIVQVPDFDFEVAGQYVTSSKDEKLFNLARSVGKKYVGSTSSMSGVIAHFHYLISQWRRLNTRMLSHEFPVELDTFTTHLRAPTAIFLRNKGNGVYAIDADKEFDTETVLTLLGRAMEKMLTMTPDKFDQYRKENSHTLDKDEINAPDTYNYSTMGDFLMRSQLDAQDDRLPGEGMFDLKTRACAAIRFDVHNFHLTSGYQIKTLRGEWESFEREYYDMIRAAFLKYSIQARIGRMDGMFIAFHNTETIFGFQYIPLKDMDYAIHGTREKVADEEFKLSIELWNRLLDKATKQFPGKSLRIHFETRETITPCMYIFAEPMEEADIDEIQNSTRKELKEFLVELEEKIKRKPKVDLRPKEEIEKELIEQLKEAEMKEREEQSRVREEAEEEGEDEVDVLESGSIDAETGHLEAEERVKEGELRSFFRIPELDEWKFSLPKLHPTSFTAGSGFAGETVLLPTTKVETTIPNPPSDALLPATAHTPAPPTEELTIESSASLSIAPEETPAAPSVPDLESIRAEADADAQITGLGNFSAETAETGDVVPLDPALAEAEAVSFEDVAKGESVGAEVEQDGEVGDVGEVEKVFVPIDEATGEPIRLPTEEIEGEVQVELVTEPVEEAAEAEQAVEEVVREPTLSPREDPAVQSEAEGVAQAEAMEVPEEQLLKPESLDFNFNLPKLHETSIPSSQQYAGESVSLGLSEPSSRITKPTPPVSPLTANPWDVCIMPKLHNSHDVRSPNAYAGETLSLGGIFNNLRTLNSPHFSSGDADTEQLMEKINELISDAPEMMKLSLDDKAKRLREIVATSLGRPQHALSDEEYLKRVFFLAPPTLDVEAILASDKLKLSLDNRARRLRDVIATSLGRPIFFLSDEEYLKRVISLAPPTLNVDDILASDKMKHLSLAEKGVELRKIIEESNDSIHHFVLTDEESLQRRIHGAPLTLDVDATLSLDSIKALPAGMKADRLRLVYKLHNALRKAGSFAMSTPNIDTILSSDETLAFSEEMKDLSPTQKVRHLKKVYKYCNQIRYLNSIAPDTFNVDRLLNSDEMKRLRFEEKGKRLQELISQIQSEGNDKPLVQDTQPLNVDDMLVSDEMEDLPADMTADKKSKQLKKMIKRQQKLLELDQQLHAQKEAALAEEAAQKKAKEEKEAAEKKAEEEKEASYPPLLGMKLSIFNYVNNTPVVRPDVLGPNDSWHIEYAIEEFSKPSTAWDKYTALMKRRQKAALGRGGGQDMFIKTLRGLAAKGRVEAARRREDEKGVEPVVWTSSVRREEEVEEEDDELD